MKIENELQSFCALVAIAVSYGGEKELDIHTQLHCLVLLKAA